MSVPDHLLEKPDPPMVCELCEADVWDERFDEPWICDTCAADRRADEAVTRHQEERDE